MVGKLNRKIQIEVWGSQQDDAGGVSADITESWQQWADAEIYNGNTQSRFSSEQWIYDAKFTVRSIRDIKSNYTILYNGVRYSILSVKKKQERRNFYTEIRAAKKDLNG